MYIHDESSMDAMNPESATFPSSLRIAWDMLISNPSVLGYTDKMLANGEWLETWEETLSYNREYGIMAMVQNFFYGDEMQGLSECISEHVESWNWSDESTDEMVNRIESQLATLLDSQSPYRFIIESILIRMIADHSGV